MLKILILILFIVLILAYFKVDLRLLVGLAVDKIHLWFN